MGSTGPELKTNKMRTREEILRYISDRSSGRGQSQEFSFESFYNEMVEMVRIERSQGPELPIHDVSALFTIPEMKQAYEHAQWSIIDHGHGETSEEYMKRKHNVR